MKARGIVRRIDDLGRVVIPKEIRRLLKIREGDPLEIFTGKNEDIILRKYSPIGEIAPFASQLCETVSRISGYTVAVSDRDAIIAISGPSQKDLADKKISYELEAIIDNRQSHFDRIGGNGIKIVQDYSRKSAFAAVPIIVLGDITGCALIIGDENDICTDAEMKLCQSIAGFLSMQIEA